MSRLTRTIIFFTLLVVTMAVAWVILSLWVCKEPWLNHLWANASYVLHQEWFAVPLVAIIYFTAFLVVRWHLVASPMRRELLGAIIDAKFQLDLEPLDSPGKKSKIDAMREILCVAVEGVNGIGILDRVFWTRGQEVPAWSHVDDVECELAVLQPFDKVKASLETAERRLRDMPTEDREATSLADLIRKELDRAASEPSDLFHDRFRYVQSPEVPTEDKEIAILPDLIGIELGGTVSEPSKSIDARFRCLLYEARGVIDGHDENDLDDTMNWHNKTIWLIWLGVLLVISLEGTRRGGGGLFAAGAAGGFLSRLRRAMKSVDDLADSGLYWTTFFLSPLVGALAGWAGILLIELAVKIGVLGSGFSAIAMGTGYGSLALAVAFLLGFSERFFDAIAGSVEDKVSKKNEEKSTSSSSSSSSGNSPSSSKPSTRPRFRTYIKDSGGNSPQETGGSSLDA